MRSILSPTHRRGVAVLGATALAAGLLAALSGGSAVASSGDHSSHRARVVRAADATSVTVRKGGPDRSVTFRRAHPGETFVTAKVSARGVSWAAKGNESAVVSAYVDGHYATDIVITSDTAVTRQFALGQLGKGKHTLLLRYATKRSPSNAGVATLRAITFTTVRPSNPAYVAAEYAPILRGRNLSDDGGPFENNHTDAPLVAWHEVTPASKPGHSIIKYSVVWSNEDGGTPTNWLMAQWGRTTDIEWIYQVEVTAAGKRVAGTGVFQSPNHGTDVFHGTYDGTHPILQTCTNNNNVCDSKLLAKQKPKQASDRMRFALSTLETLPAGQPREYVMDQNPWTYQVMAREMVREKKIEKPADPSTPAMSDQRNYLFLTLTRSTDPASSASIDGLAVDVVLFGDDTVTYSSDHETFTGQPGFGQSVNRDGPFATTVELPPGTTATDIKSISVRRTKFGTTADDGAPITVSAIGRALFLNSDYLPEEASFVGSVGAVLTTANPTAVLFGATE